MLSLLFLLLLCMGGHALAQTPGNTTVTGNVTNLEGKPIECATMVLVQAADSTAGRNLNGVVTDVAGQSRFEHVAAGSY